MDGFGGSQQNLSTATQGQFDFTLMVNGPISSRITLRNNDAPSADRRMGTRPRPRADNSKELLARVVDESMIGLELVGLRQCCCMRDAL